MVEKLRGSFVVVPDILSGREENKTAICNRFCQDVFLNQYFHLLA
jgi:hypothetical protein